MSLIPGPTTYNPPNDIASKAEHFLSKLSAPKVKSFSKCPRICHVVDIKSTVPGPGTYKVLSEFGPYEKCGEQKKIERKNYKVNTYKKGKSLLTLY